MATRRRAQVGIELDFERKPFYSPAEIAEILGISDQTVLERIHQAQLFAVRLGPRLYRIPLGSLLQFLGVPPAITRTRRPDAAVDAERDDSQDADEH